MDIKEFKKIVGKSKTFSEVSKKIYGNVYYGNRQTIKKRIVEYGINIDHFDYKPRLNNNFIKRTLNEILISGSTYNTTKLKERLYKEGLKDRKCEKCGQNENWNGEYMSLILDHINGDHNDNRLVNLRILCPNCNATLPTHGGKNIKNRPSKCERKKYYEKKTKNEIFEIDKLRSIKQRTVKRPPYNELIENVEINGYSATGRKYGVSDNAIRKWIKFYEKEMVL